MTKFNPENKEVLTFGEALGPAMEITSSEDAHQYFKDYVEYTKQMLIEHPREDNLTAEDICRINLGYYAGYYDAEVQRRVNKLFETTHPVLGDY